MNEFERVPEYIPPEEPEQTLPVEPPPPPVSPEPSPPKAWADEEFFECFEETPADSQDSNFFVPPSRPKKRRRKRR